MASRPAISAGLTCRRSPRPIQAGCHIIDLFKPDRPPTIAADYADRKLAVEAETRERIRRAVIRLTGDGRSTFWTPALHPGSGPGLRPG